MDGQNFNYQNNTNGANNNEPKKADTLAIVSLVLGILAIVLACCNTYISIIAAIVGIVCSVLSKKNNGKTGIATAGFICSIVAIVISILLIILAVAGLAILESAGIDYSSYL